MGIIAKQYTFTAGSTIIASEHNTNYDTLYDVINGNISNVNVPAAAGIAGSKIIPTFTTNTSVTGNLTLEVAGNGMKIKEGTNASMGTGLLSGGTSIVSNTLIAADSRVFLTCIVVGGTAGSHFVDSITAGVSFNIVSTIETDSSTVAFQIINPA